MPAFLLTFLAKLGIKNKYVAYSVLSLIGVVLIHFYGLYQYNSGVSDERDRQLKKELKERAELAERKTDAQDKAGVVFINSLKDRLEQSSKIEQDLSNSLLDIDIRYPDPVQNETTCTPDADRAFINEQRELARAKAISDAQWKAYCVNRSIPECKPYQFK